MGLSCAAAQTTIEIIIPAATTILLNKRINAQLSTLATAIRLTFFGNLSLNVQPHLMASP
jgi:hypothetical protein